MRQDFSSDFSELVGRIERGEPFTLLRFADGEHAFIRNSSVRGIDGWLSPGKETRLGGDLRRALAVDGRRYVLGLPCECCTASCNGGLLKDLIGGTNAARSQITFSNIFVNANYRRQGELFAALKKRNVLLICSAVSETCSRDMPFGPVTAIPCPRDCRVWEDEREELMKMYRHEVSKVSGSTVLLAAGPMSEPIAVELSEFNPTNQYIDIGSSLDMFVHMKPTRPYQIDTADANQYCTMRVERRRDRGLEDLLDYGSKVSVIINGYKRPEAVDMVVEALLGQSVLPREIVIRWNDIESSKRSRYQRHISSLVSSRNTGVWSRFHDAFDLSGEYVCIFDDDTVPGSRWLENCLATIQTNEGLLGTVGVIFNGINQYMDNRRVGWASANETVQQVDLVGHSWFFKREWLNMYWSERAPDGLHLAGEDIHFSYVLQRNGINTYVPPHPISDLRLWGSIKGNELGTSNVAISMMPNSYERWDIPFRHYLNRGWRLMCKES